MEQKLNLAKMAQGAFMEQFNLEFGEVLDNIADPNTDPKKPRKITLTMVFKPDENREVISVETQSKSALVPPKPLSTTIVIDRDSDGSVVGAEIVSGQKGQMFLDSNGEIKDDRGNVVNIQQR